MPSFNRSNRGGGSGGGRSFGKRSFGKRSFDDRDSRRPSMHKAVCAECGNSCEVPFKPSHDRDVFCNNCFRGNDDGGSRRSDDRNYRERSFDRDAGPSMHKAICEECGKSCEVPFKPSHDKPIFCSNCFKKGGNDGNKKADQFKEQLEILNIKLDRILKMLATPAKETDQEQAMVKKIKTIKILKPEVKPKKTVKKEVKVVKKDTKKTAKKPKKA